MNACTLTLNELLLDFFGALLVLEKIIKQDIANLRRECISSIAICLLENHRYHLEVVMRDYLKKADNVFDLMKEIQNRV